MPFFPNLDLLFIHIPKTGGTTIEKYLSITSNSELNANTLYYRHTTNINNELTILRKNWRKYINLLFDDEVRKLLQEKKYAKNKKEIEERLVHIKTNVKEYMDDIKKRLPEFIYFRKIRMVREKGHSLHHFTWNELEEYKKFFFDEITQKKLYDKSSNQTCNILTSIRNPYDRIVSEMFFTRRIRNGASKEEVCGAIKLYLLSEESFDNHKTPQYEFVIDKHGNLLENIQIVRQETLNDDMERLGFPNFKNMHCQLINKVFDNQQYINLLNDEAIELINEYYKKDFELFQYNMIRPIKDSHL